jgi:hypothetical protein
MRARVSLLCLVLASCGASTDPEPAQLGVHRNGLVPLGQIRQPTPSPHLAELVGYQDRYVYVANSNDGVAVYELLPTETPPADFDDPLSAWPQAPELQPGLALRVDRVELLRCTTLALHPTTASLYCGEDSGLGIARFDLTDPSAPALSGAPWQAESQIYVRDMLVLDDRLLLARYDRGLAWTTIDEQGQLGELQEHELGANVRMLAASDEHLWVLTADRGLIVLDPNTLEERASLAMPGPALDLSTAGDRAIVALGSAGARIVEWTGDALEHVEAMHPPGVVTAVDLHGDAAAVVTLSGAWLYDLRSPDALPESIAADPVTAAGAWSPEEPRLAGFRAAGDWTAAARDGAMLYARFIGDSLLITDWTWVERYAIDLDGFPTGVDVASGTYVAAEAAEIPLVLRNSGGVPQEIEVLSIDHEPIERFELGPFETAVRRYPAERFELGVPVLLMLRVHDRGGYAARTATVVLRRPPLEEWPMVPYGEPAPGQMFPDVVLGTAELGQPTVVEPLALPLPDRAQRIVFYGSDCVAMWPEIDDLVWRARAGELGDVDVVFASNDHIGYQGGAAERWLIDGLAWGFFDPAAMGELIEQNPWEQLYEEAFELRELPAAANHPTDYELDAEGRVIAAERQYRGTYPLFAGALE